MPRYTRREAVYDMKLNEETRKLLTKEHAWLDKRLPKTANDFRVQRVDRKLLQMVPHGDSPYHLEIDYFDMLDKDGEVICSVGFGTRMVRRPTLITSWPFFKMVTKEKSYNIRYESIGEALVRMGPKAKDVRYILLMLCDPVRINITLCKVPRDWDDILSGLEKVEARKALEEVKVLNASLSD